MTVKPSYAPCVLVCAMVTVTGGRFVAPEIGLPMKGHILVLMPWNGAGRDDVRRASIREMSLERFRVPRTPESRTPLVLLWLAALGGIGYAYRTLAESEHGAAIVVIVAASLVLYALIRYVAGRRRRL